MKIKSISLLSLFALIMSSPNTMAEQSIAIVDDFNHLTSNTLGVPRQHLDDTVAGGRTSSKIEVAEGQMHVWGEIVPPRGQPGWRSSVLLLDPIGKAKDLSQYTGVKIRIKITKGTLSLSANSLEISNFDYHAAMIPIMPDGKFHEVHLPFSDMKRTWSEQTKLNLKSVNSLSLVAFAMQPAPFDFVVDRISFY